MSNYERSAIQFITRINEYNGDAGNIIPYGLQLLQKFTGAYLSLQIVPQDSYAARIRNATPFFLDDMALNATAVKEVSDAGNDNIIYWKSIPAQKHVFSDILLALSSAMIMPVQQGDTTVLIMLGWSAPQEFDESFQLFAELVKSHLDKTIQQSVAVQMLGLDSTLHTALLETMPQAVIYIDDEGLGGWINTNAATLLQLPQAGRQDPAPLSAAMAALRSRLINADEVNRKSALLFTNPDTTLTDWLWQLNTGNYTVSVHSVNTAAVKGRLWIFEQHNA
ncbi:hypothetical protein ACTHGU_20645 [Chitinophagaceae bacterium MMS25-I14]